MTLTNYKTANNANSTLASGIGAGATSLVCATGQGGRFPSTFPFLMTIEKTVAEVVTKREIVKVTNRAGDAFTIVRSAGYCLASDSATTQTNTAQSFDSGDVISLRLTGEIIDDLNAEAVRLENAKLDIADYQNGEKVYASSSTGTDAYAITLDPPITAYVVSQTFKFSADVANTGSATLNVNGLGAKTIKKQHDVDLSSGDIEAGQFVTVTYDGTNFQMDSQIATIPNVNINGETEDTTGDMDADFMHVYDNIAGANRKQKLNVYRASDAETIAGTSNTKFVTPANLTARFPYPETLKILTSDFTVASTTTLTTITNLSGFSLESGKVYEFEGILQVQPTGSGGTNGLDIDMVLSSSQNCWFQVWGSELAADTSKTFTWVGRGNFGWFTTQEVFSAVNNTNAMVSFKWRIITTSTCTVDFKIQMDEADSTGTVYAGSVIKFRKLTV